MQYSAKVFYELRQFNYLISASSERSSNSETSSDMHTNLHRYVGRFTRVAQDRHASRVRFQ